MRSSSEAIDHGGHLTVTMNEGTFYREVIRLLGGEKIPFLVGGAFAVRHYAGIDRDTKDLDLFVLPQDAGRVISACRRAGYDAKMFFDHWLAKIQSDEESIDVIFRGANGLCEVDFAWFGNAAHGELLGERVSFCPVEETIWMKAYVMERRRYDGADIVHLIRSCTSKLDWERLISIFGRDWKLLLSYLLLVHFVYPGEKIVPDPVIGQLTHRLRDPPAADLGKICAGTLLSAVQYLPDIERFGYTDARLHDDRVKMSEAEIAAWKANVLKAEAS